jgi:hypothetical protein
MSETPTLLLHAPWLWLVLAVASSLLSAQNVETNRRAKQEGFRLNFWRMSIAALFWLPLTLLEKWPTDLAFYAAGIFGGMAIILGFTIQNDLANRHNGRVAIIHMPLKAVLVFALWAMFDPIAREHVFHNPLITVGVVAALATMVFALAEFRKNDVSWSSFRAVLPIVVVYAFGDIFARLTITPDQLHARLVIFLFLVAASSAIGSLLMWPWRPKPELPLYTPKLMKDAVRAAMGSTANQVCFFMALVLGPSPAYVSMVALMAPVWLLGYHRWAGIKDDANPLAGTIVVAAAILLMFIVA